MLITRNQLAKELGVTPKWVTECRKSGRLPDCSPGTKLYDREKALAHWQEWQARVNQEDEDSVEYLESVLRLWKSRVKLSNQKALNLQLSTILAGSAKQTYDQSRDILEEIFTEAVSNAAIATIGETRPSHISDTVKAFLDIAFDQLSDRFEKDLEPEAPEAFGFPETDNPALDLKKRIEVQKTEYNRSEALIRETRAELASGLLISYSDFEHIFGERHGSARSALLALPAQVAAVILGYSAEAARTEMLKKVADALENIVPFDLNDFRSAVTAELTEQDEGDAAESTAIDTTA
jgi:hypothetical protein